MHKNVNFPFPFAHLKQSTQVYNYRCIYSFFILCFEVHAVVIQTKFCGNCPRHIRGWASLIQALLCKCKLLILKALTFYFHLPNPSYEAFLRCAVRASYPVQLWNVRILGAIRTKFSFISVKTLNSGSVKFCAT